MEETFFIKNSLQYQRMRKHGRLRGLGLLFAALVIGCAILELNAFESLYSPLQDRGGDFNNFISWNVCKY